MPDPEQIVSVTLTSDGRMEVISRTKLIGVGQPAPDKITKRIYAAADGRIVLERTVDGRYTPPRWVPEAIEFDNKAADGWALAE